MSALSASLFYELCPNGETVAAVLVAQLGAAYFRTADIPQLKRLQIEINQIVDVVAIQFKIYSVAGAGSVAQTELGVVERARA